MRGLLFLGDRRAELREFSDPAAGPGQVVVRMKAAAICGSDVHYYRLPGKGPDTERFKFIQGHEPCGVVHAVGPGVTKVRSGDPVVVYHYLGCGHCEHCAAGDYFYCTEGRRGYGWHVDGSMADYILADERNCLPLPSELSWTDGAFIACIAGTAYSSLKKLEVSGRDTVLVNGLGPVGLVMVMLAQASGARVIGVDVTAERLALARDLGCEVLDAAHHDVPTEVFEMTKGQGASAGFDSTGVPAANANCIRAMGFYGRVVFVGMSYIQDGINLGSGDLTFMYKQLKLMGNTVYPRHMYWEITRFLIEHGIRLERIVTHRFALEEGVQAMRVADDGRCGKIVFEW